MDQTNNRFYREITTTDDGGPAFPMLSETAVHRRGCAAIEGVTDPNERDRLYTEAIDRAGAGMPLRDYFAAKAMQTILASVVDVDGSLTTVAIESVTEGAYFVANAMLRARRAQRSNAESRPETTEAGTDRNAALLRSLGHNYYAPDGTLMNANGTRSIFDDVDK